MYYLYKIGQFISLSLPLKVTYTIAALLANLYFIFSIQDKEALVKNIKTVLKGKGDDKLYRFYAKNVFINFAKYLVDFFRISKLNKSYVNRFIKIEGKEFLDDVLKKQKGAILLSSHIGNWELGAAVVSYLGYPTYVIALDHKDKRVNNFFLNQRGERGVQAISIGISLKKCFRILKENKILGILGDRDFSETGIRIKFFGKETLIPKGPAIFSLRTGAPLVPTFMIREKSDNFKLFIEKPINHSPTGNDEKDIEDFVSSYISVIERYIKTYPDQWYVFRSVWN